MGFDKVKMKQIQRLMILAAVLALILKYSGGLLESVLLGIGFLTPFIVGGAMAFILNLPMRLLEEKLFAGWKGKTASLKRTVSIILSIVIVLFILFLVFVTVIPQITQTIVVLGNEVPAFVDDMIKSLEKLSKEYPQLKEEVAKLSSIEIDWEKVGENVLTVLKSGVGSVVVSTVSIAGAILGGVANFVIALVFAIYILSQKEKLQNQAKRLIKAYLSEKACRKTEYVCSLLHRNFSKFITGQCLEAVILGAMFVVVLSIFRMPYAFMIGVLIAFTALIPIVGAFIGCAISTFLILIENPMQALIFLILFLVIQQLEGNLIYPKVVGNSVGLPSIWVLVAVSLGGSLFGVIGMLTFIPLLSTIYTLIKENVNNRNRKKEEDNNKTRKAMEKAKELNVTEETKAREIKE